MTSPGSRHVNGGRQPVMVDSDAFRLASVDRMECPLCFCAVDSLDKHRVWHDQQRRERERVEDRIKQLEQELRRFRPS
jgi:hypothetical protein